jgi:anti-sigma regulatory factor (Ser/Thr protein kinase)
LPQLPNLDQTIALGQFPRHLRSAGEARRFVTSACADHVSSDKLDSIALLVSELVTNAVVHAQSDAAVQVTRGSRRLMVAVTDEGPGTPVARHTQGHETNGRGLDLVDLLAASWGVEWGAGDKTVWFAVCCS